MMDGDRREMTVEIRFVKLIKHTSSVDASLNWSIGLEEKGSLVFLRACLYRLKHFNYQAMN